MDVVRIRHESFLCQGKQSQKEMKFDFRAEAMCAAMCCVVRQWA